MAQLCYNKYEWWKITLLCMFVPLALTFNLPWRSTAAQVFGHWLKKTYHRHDKFFFYIYPKVNSQSPISFVKEPSDEQECLVPGWIHVVPEDCVVKATLPAIPHPTPNPVSETPTWKEVTTTNKKGKTAKSVPRVMIGPKQIPATKLNKPVKPGKPSQPKSKKLVVSSQPVTHWDLWSPRQPPP